MERYSQLLSLHPASVEYNYRYGACLVYAEADKEKALKHLRFAAANSGAPIEVHYFLGKAYHLNYQFEEAIASYEKYKQLTGGKRNAAYHVDLALRQCKNGLNLLSNIKDVKVLNKVETSVEDFFRNYELDDIGGRILVCPEELLTKYDLKSGERFLMYFPGNTSTAFFSSYGKNGENGRDIYRATRLPNGNWSKPIPMTQINTPYNDDYPFLNADGKTFYFASEGHSSMGGYDIFKCEYNASDDSFTQPQNLDFAVSSADDDLLYITDKQHKLAYFASSRSSNYDRMHVYKVLVSSNPLKITFLKGVFKSEIPEVTNAAHISVVDANTNQEIGNYQTNPQTGEFVIDLPRSGRYKFTVDATGSKHAHTGLVEVPGADETVAYQQELKLVTANGLEKLIIKNEFDRPITEGLYDLAQGVLRHRAGLDVNADGSEQVAEADTPIADGAIESAYTAAGFSASMSNRAVLEAARSEEAAIAEKRKTMERQRDYAFTLAQKKNEVAQKAARDAEDYMRMADAVGNEEKSSQYLMQAMASKYAAEKNAKESKVALQLAQQLNERMDHLGEAHQVAATLAENVEAALDTDNYGEVVQALSAYKEHQVEQSENPIHQQDEYLILRTQAREKLQANTLQSDRAQELRDDENSLTLRIKNRKLHLETAKKKDKPAIEQEIQLLEEDLAAIKSEADQTFAQLDDAQSRAGELSQQAELFQRIDNNQTEVYIPESEVLAFNPGEVETIQADLSRVDSETESLEPNLEIVERILVEEGNVALEAFGNESDYEEFIAQYNLPSRTQQEPKQTENEEINEETLRAEIEAANNWMDVIDESMRELEAERAELPAGSQRDEVDSQLAEFQELKFKKVKEVDEAKKQLSALQETARAPYTIADEEATATADAIPKQDEEPEQKQTTSPNDRKTQTIAQQSPVYELVDPNYQSSVESLTNANLDQEEALRQKNALDRNFIEKIDQKLSEVAGGNSPNKEQLIEELNTLRSTVSSDLALNESLLASNGDELTQKTSTEILLQESGLVSEDDQTATTESGAAPIPESISYQDIDPTYTEKLSQLENNNNVDSEAERLVLENELHRTFVTDIDDQIAGYQARLQNATPSEKTRIERVIGQLEQVKALKEQEISSNVSERETMLEQAFYAENKLITQEVDTGYANQYLAIEKSEASPYLKAVEKATLERDIAKKMEARVAQLTDELDATNSIERKNEIQETIQNLEDLRQEKTIAYESLFVQADALQQEGEALAQVEHDNEIEPEEPEFEEETATLPTDSPTRVEDERRMAPDESIEESAPPTETADEPRVETEAPEPAIAAETDGPGEGATDVDRIQGEETAAVEAQITEFIDNNETVRQDLKQYTVFAEVDDMVYKSLNASLDMEAIGGDLRRHQQQIAAFASSDQTGELNEIERVALTIHLKKELVLQEKIAAANRREMEFYEVGNQQLFETIEQSSSQPVDAEAMLAARQAEQQADSLRKIAQTLRKEAAETVDFDERMVLQKAAFEQEVAAIQSFAKVNATLEQWSKGQLVPWPAEDEEVVVVAHRAAPPESKSEPLAQETEAPASRETQPVLASQDGQESAQPTQTEIEPTLTSGAIDHFDLTESDTERIGSAPVLLGWFDQQWKADSLELVKTQRFTQAERLLNEAEEKLVTAEGLNEEAASETDAAKQRDYNNRAAELQAEARALFDEARRLREEMSAYENAAADAREEANALLAEMSDQERSTAEGMLPQTTLANRTAEDQPNGDTPTNTTSTEHEQEAPQSDRQTEPETPAIEAPSTPELEQPASSGNVDSESEASQTAQQVPAEDEIEDTLAEPITVEDEPAILSTEVQTTRPNESQAAPIDFSAGITQAIEFINEPAYSASNPIPVNPDWPEGLVFAVQVGAFRNPIPQDHFSGFTPIRGERISSGITRYSAGLFAAFNEARSAQDAIRNLGYSDAFVVAYLNGERIALNRALNETQAAEIIARAEAGRSTAAQNQVGADPTTETASDAPETTDGTTAAMALDAETDRQASSERASDIETLTGLPTDYYNDPDAAPATQVERITGLFFTVQVGVYSNPVAQSDLNNISPLNSEQTANGYIRYTSGMFPSVKFAQDHRQIVVNAGVADAFVTAYNNGRRITVSEARSILARDGAAVLAGSPSEAPQVEPEPRSNEGETPAETDTPSESPIDEAAPPSEFADVTDFEPEDIRFVLDLGSFGTGMPQGTADAILQIPEAGVSRLELMNGKMHYLSRPTASYAEVEALKESFEEKGAENIQIRAMALGFLLDVADARQATGQ